jgi:hypothetical protein
MTQLCPNCGAPREDAFCSHCGQSDRVYMRSVVSLAKDMIVDQLELDSRLFRTVRALLFEPGRLTREFVANRRARYVSPVRLYLAISVVFFFVLSLTGDLDVTTFRADDTAIVGGDTDTLPSDFSPQEKELRQRVLDMLKDPQAATETIVNRLPIALFITLPFYAAFLKLLFWRSYYAEHLVFALHLHAFLFLLGTLMIVMPENAFGEAVVRVLQLVGGIYYFIALHRTYPEPWLTTFGKFVVINALHVTLIATAIAATTFFTLFF